RRVILVAVEHPGEAAHVELAGRPRGHGPARVVEQEELDAWRRPPARARLPQHVCGLEDRVDAELGRAVELPEHRPEDRERLLLHPRRARCGGDDEHAHRGDVVARAHPLRQVDDALDEHRRRSIVRSASSGSNFRMTTTVPPKTWVNWAKLPGAEW